MKSELQSPILEDILSRVDQNDKEFSFLKKDGKDPTVEEIGDGNLNFIYRITKHDEKGQLLGSFVVKQSVPYIKCLGEGYPLGLERIDIEYKALSKFHALSPGSVPIPFSYLKDINAVCMEDLRDHVVFRKKLIGGELNMDAVQDLARHLGVVHRETHIAILGEGRLNELDQEFENSNMLSLTEQYVFTQPFARDGESNRCSAEVAMKLDDLYGDNAVIAAASHMKKIFLEKKECLVHGDLHTGSVMVKGTDARMMDNEFAYVGPAAFDLGVLIANYIFSYYRHMSIPEDNDAHRQFAYKMIEASTTTVSTYLSHMTCSVGEREAYVSNLMSETAGFAGCELIRRTVGAAHVEDVDNMQYAEVDALGAGLRLLQAYHRIDSVDRLLFIALMLC